MTNDKTCNARRSDGARDNVRLGSLVRRKRKGRMESERRFVPVEMPKSQAPPNGGGG